VGQLTMAAARLLVLGLVGILRDDEPAFSLTAFSPRLPSPSVPERIKQIARSPSSSANERRKKSTAGGRRDVPAVRRVAGRRSGSRDRHPAE
jgi:hypothetical protein